MLKYLGIGKRDYHRNPIRIYPRKVWEFQAVLRGGIAPVFKAGPEPLQTSSLWVMPPNLPHGWSSHPDSTAEVVVFHYHEVPAQFSWFLPYCPYLRIPLSAKDISLLKNLAREVQSLVGDLTMAGRLRHSRVLHELCLIGLRSPTMENLLHHVSPAQKLVEQACDWFADHLVENPGLPEISQAVASSPASLRRHFHRVLGLSPVEALSAIRHRQALHLLAHRVKHEEIAVQCGYSSASAFSRSFKSRLGYSPREWQEREGINPGK